MAATHEDRNANLSPGVAIKAPCRAATTGAITLSGEQTIDAVACVTGDRVLVKNQTSSINNGIYGVSTGTWAREPDFDGNRDVVTGTFVFITSGATNAGAFYECTTTGTVVFGTSNITFAVGALGPIAIPISGSNVTFTQSGTPTANSVAAKLQQIISVKDAPFNAAGDGVTDDTAAIQAALNAMTNGGTLWLPPGSYKITSTLSLPTGTPFLQIVGSNMAVGVAATGFASGFDFTNAVSGTPCIEYAGTINAEAHTCLVLTGFGINLNNNNTRGIHLKGVSDARVERVFLSGVVGGTNRGIYLEDMISSRIAYCLMRNLQYGIVSDQIFNNNIIEGCNIWDMDQYAILLRGNVGAVDGGFQSTIRGNNFIRINGATTYQGALRMVAPLHGVVFEKNTVETMQAQAVLGSRTDPISGAGASYIENFVERDNTYIACAGSSCVDIDYGSGLSFGPSLNSSPGGGMSQMFNIGANSINDHWIYPPNNTGGKNILPSIAAVEVPIRFLNGVATRIQPVGLVTPAYGALIAIDAAAGDFFNIVATNNTPFTVANPTTFGVASRNHRITIRIKNTSGGALGGLTWDTAYKPVNTTQPANGNSRTRVFEYDGTNYVEIASGVDVPN